MDAQEGSENGFVESGEIEDSLSFSDTTPNEPKLRDYLKLRVIHPFIEAVITMFVLIILLILFGKGFIMPDAFMLLIFSLIIFLAFHLSIYYVGIEVMLRKKEKIGTAFALVCISYFVLISFWPLVITGSGIDHNFEKAAIISLFLLPPLQYMITVLWLSRLRILLLRSVLIITFYYLIIFGIAEVLFL